MANRNADYSIGHANRPEPTGYDRTALPVWVAKARNEFPFVAVNSIQKK